MTINTQIQQSVMSAPMNGADIMVMDAYCQKWTHVGVSDTLWCDGSNPMLTAMWEIARIGVESVEDAPRDTMSPSETYTFAIGQRAEICRRVADALAVLNVGFSVDFQ